MFCNQQSDYMYRSVALKSAFLLASILLIGIALISCAQSTDLIPKPTQTAAATPTLLPLGPETNWHTVFTLDNVSSSSVTIGQSFVATKTYTILFNCEGHGTVTVTVTFGAIGGNSEADTAVCGATPIPHGIPNVQPSPRGEAAQVSVSWQGSVVWQVLVEMQN